MEPSGGKRPTLKDVAALAGVDASLVSRVVSQATDFSIPQTTRARVMDAVVATGYRPSAVARSLKTRRLATLGLIIPDLTNPVYAPIVAGAQARAAAEGYALLLATDTEGQAPEAVRGLVRMLAEDRVDGLLVGSGTARGPLLDMLADVRKPVLLVNRAAPGISSVTVDDFAGARTATDYLIAQGHTSIAHLGGPVGVDTTARRLNGFREALSSSLPASAARTVHAASWGALDGYTASLDLLRSLTTETAVFAANVTLAIGLYRAAQELGLEIPVDLSVVALHDYDLAAMLMPSLTTVSMPLRELGERATSLLLEMIDGKQGSDQMIETAPILIVRDSVREL